ncbi:MAG: AraC family ligand binding domain-containing protein [Bacilli bacterium]|nr:AraC family ligand binding domain-containing protein [Bacilli bacterium]
MSKRINVTEYPVEYDPRTPSVVECYCGGVESIDLPDSRIAAMHYHSSYQIGVCLEGDGVFLIKDAIYAVKQGDAVIIAPDEIHCSRGIKNGKCRWDFVYFDPYEMKNRYPELYLPTSSVITENETWCWKEESEEGVIYHTAYTMEGRTIFSEGEATYGLSLTAGIALYYTYLEIAYAPLRDFVSEEENHDYEYSNFYASEAGTLELDAKAPGTSYALSFASYSPKRVNYKNFTEEGETVKTGIIQYSYAVKSLAHPTDPSPEE